ncbi:putative membrane protein [Proteus phage SJ_PmiM]|nr:putative membrane protein [Proteus phage SJ_PmiM]
MEFLLSEMFINIMISVIIFPALAIGVYFAFRGTFE